MCVLSIKVPIQKSGNLSYAPRIYKEKVLTIGDRVYVDLSLNSVDSKSMLLGDTQFLIYVFIGLIIA